MFPRIAVLFVLGLVVMIPGTLTATPTDAIAIYFDAGYQIHCDSTAIFVPLTAFLVLHNPTEDVGINGFQVRLETVGDPIVGDMTFPVPAVQIGSVPDYMVGFGLPLVPQESMLLASFPVFATAPSAFAISFLSSGEFPAYDGGASGIVPFYCLFGGFGNPSATLGALLCPGENPGFGIAAKSTSWGGMKALFR